MKDDLLKPMTISYIKLLIAVGIILVTGAFAWGDMKSTVKENNDQTATLIQMDTHLNTKVSDMDSQVNQMAISVAKLQQVIADSEASGRLLTACITPSNINGNATLTKAYSPVPSTSPAFSSSQTAGPSAMTSSTSQPQNVTFESTYTYPTPQPEGNSNPSPSPTSSPSLLKTVGDLLGI